MKEVMLVLLILMGTVAAAPIESSPGFWAGPGLMTNTDMVKMEQRFYQSLWETYQIYYQNLVAPMEVQEGQEAISTDDSYNQTYIEATAENAADINATSSNMTELNASANETATAVGGASSFDLSNLDVSSLYGGMRYSLSGDVNDSQPSNQTDGEELEDNLNESAAQINQTGIAAENLAADQTGPGIIRLEQGEEQEPENITANSQINVSENASYSVNTSEELNLSQRATVVLINDSGNDENLTTSEDLNAADEGDIQLNETLPSSDLFSDGKETSNEASNQSLNDSVDDSPDETYMAASGASNVTDSNMTAVNLTSLNVSLNETLNSTLNLVNASNHTDNLGQTDHQVQGFAQTPTSGQSQSVGSDVNTNFGGGFWSLEASRGGFGRDGINSRTYLSGDFDIEKDVIFHG